MPEIQFQPKQSALLKLLTDHPAPVIGAGGGRGAAKSYAADACAITLMCERPGIAICMVMRTWVKQMVPFHLEAIRNNFPWATEELTSSPPAKLRIGRSRMEFKYAENYEAVEEAFRSGNYDLIIVDQAEQFTWRELVEVRKAARSKGKTQAKLLLLFNMRGACIHELRRVFHTHEVGNPDDFEFIKFNPWDNVQWVIAALEHDGYTIDDYYAWTDQQRKDYAAERGPYTKQLASDDPVISKADWEGDWDSIEGAYFSGSFDLESTRISAFKVGELQKPWATHWMSQDYGKAHYTSHHWHYRVTLSPSEVEKYLGWERKTPLNVVVTYREMIVNEMNGQEIGRKVVECTPLVERSKIKSFFLSPELVTDDLNTIGSQQSKELRPYGLPGATKADNERVGGWGLMAKLLKASKQRGIDPEGKEYPDCWFISAECVEALKALPMAMRDPKNIDDVLKTDKTQAKLEQDVLDDLRYGLKTMLAPKKKTDEDKYQESMAVADPAARMMIAFKHEQRKVAKRRVIMPPSWKGNL